jgi:hypothetical protein
VADKTPRKSPPPKSKKKQWESPRVKSGQLFESNSLACGKNNSGMDECMDNGTRS